MMQVWIVFDFWHEIVGIFSSLEKAMACREEVLDAQDVVGPYDIDKIL